MVYVPFSRDFDLTTFEPVTPLRYPAMSRDKVIHLNLHSKE